MKVRKAVFPVAGLGTRFLPATKAMAKEMLPIVDKPLIQYAVEEAYASGIKEIIFVTGAGKAAIENHFDHTCELEHMLMARGKGHIAETILRSIGNLRGFTFLLIFLLFFNDTPISRGFWRGVAGVGTSVHLDFRLVYAGLNLFQFWAR